MGYVSILELCGIYCTFLLPTKGTCTMTFILCAEAVADSLHQSSKCCPSAMDDLARIL